jgi:predicted nucleotidyltransferase
VRIDIPRTGIENYCRKWKITESALFGSVLREDFGPDSDVDVLVILAQDAPWSLCEWVDMIEEPKAIFEHEVELVEQSGLRNLFRCHAILRTREIICAF